MFLLPYSGFALAGEPGSGARKFAQLEQLLPTPNSYRTASGAPGFAYWQQQADYKIQVALDEDNQSIVGSEQITYTNNSPDTLNYLWLQLDQNRFAEGSLDRRSQTTNPKEDKISFTGFGRHNLLLTTNTVTATLLSPTKVITPYPSW